MPLFFPAEFPSVSLISAEFPYRNKLMFMPMFFPQNLPSIFLISAEFPYRNKLISMLKSFPQIFLQFPSFPENYHTEMNSFRCIFFPHNSAEFWAILGKFKENNYSVWKFLGRMVTYGVLHSHI